jgi:hypothetical protein
MNLSPGRISQLVNRLLKEKRLKREGRKMFRPPTTRGAAPVKESRTETDISEPQKSVVGDPNVTIARHALKPAKTASDDMLSREHWHAYTSPATISQETGVPISQMLRSVAKELTDNALDWCDRHDCQGAVTAQLEGSHTIVVTNAGPGWEAGSEKLAEIFSLARGSMSSKLWRLPARGAMGLGLIQVTGSVASGDGTITIKSCNRRTVLRPQIEDGLTQIVETTQTEYPIGTEIRIEVDPAYPADPYTLQWARIAIQLARKSQPPYLGRASVHGFDTDALFGLLHAVGPKMKLRDFLSRFEGCSTRSIQHKAAERFGAKCLCSELSREEAALLLRILQEGTKPVGPHRLKVMGREAWPCYDQGYAVFKDCFEHGARAPLANIPFVVECWATVEQNEDGVEFSQFTINRTPTNSTAFARRGRGRDVDLIINGRRIELSLPKVQIRFALNITSLFVPVLSGGKRVDITPFANAVGQAVKQAVTRAQRSARRSAPANPRSKDDDQDKHPPGKLHQILKEAVELEFCSPDELTVLSKRKDPYRLDTATGHRLGRWCALLIERFLAPQAKIHLRGCHYVLASAANVTRPDGSPYINSDPMWVWFDETAMKAARWLGYVRFDRIVDERNAPPELYLPPYYTVEPERGNGKRIIVPGLAETMPCFTSPQWPVVQPYRIISVGEKTSLRPVLLPIAKEVGGELLLPTGEMSDTMIAELAARCALDPRPSVVLYFSDFDPAGRQMPVSLARKLQALRDLLYPQLNIRVHHVALTLEQVRELDLPSTPLKPKEARASRWREIMGHEQPEIDALAALNPDALTAIAREAIRPYCDPTLAERTAEAEQKWRDQCDVVLALEPAYVNIRTKIETELAQLEELGQKLSSLQDQAAALLAAVEPPPIELPFALPLANPGEPLFDSGARFADATRRLRQYRDLIDPNED